ncbi:MAG: hypothetical protein HRU11_03990 [Parvularculaceae bacterium]|nr:hypothetical protein [Parvularculaceae bacterium]
MLNVRSAVAAASMVVAAFGAAHAVVIAQYDLTQSLADQSGNGAPDLVNNGGVLTASGLTFGANQGPTWTGSLGAGDEYTITMVLNISDAVGDEDWRKLVDFDDLVLDDGFYLTTDNKFGLYEDVVIGDLVAEGPDDVLYNTDITIVLKRTAAHIVSASVNGVEQFSYQGAPDYGLAESVLHFFQDDDDTSNGEVFNGTLISLTIEDGASAAVPVPAAALLFGPAIVALRRRRQG